MAFRGRPYALPVPLLLPPEARVSSLSSSSSSTTSSSDVSLPLALELEPELPLPLELPSPELEELAAWCSAPHWRQAPPCPPAELLAAVRT